MSAFYISTRETIRKVYRIEGNYSTKEEALKAFDELEPFGDAEQFLINTEYNDYEITTIEQE